MSAGYEPSQELLEAIAVQARETRRLQILFRDLRSKDQEAKRLPQLLKMAKQSAQELDRLLANLPKKWRQP